MNYGYVRLLFEFKVFKYKSPMICIRQVPGLYEVVDLLDLGEVSHDLAAIMSAAGGRGGHHHQQMDEEESATDCEYDSVSSPGGSTCSGPIYIRHTGFGGPDSAAAAVRQQRPLSQRSDGTPSPGRASPPPEPPHLHMMQQRDHLLSRHRTLHLPDALKAAEKAVTVTISGGSGSEAKKKKKKAAGLLLCPDYAEAAVKKEIRGVQVAAGKAAATTPSGHLAAVSRPKHKKGKTVRNTGGGGGEEFIEEGRAASKSPY
jgi:hypothetical protein